MDTFGFGETAEVGNEGDVIRDTEFAAKRECRRSSRRRWYEIKNSDGAWVMKETPAACFTGEHEYESVSAVT